MKKVVLGVLKRRLMMASLHSWRGIKACFKHEEAFRIELFLAAVFLPLAPIVASNAIELALLMVSVLLVLIVELLNSAVEAAIDRIGLEHHDLSGRAKDQGSAAVTLSMLVFLIIWLSILIG
ncbi:diacylglycerol kinase [Porticoccus sp.]